MDDLHLSTYEQLKSYVGELAAAAASNVREIGFADPDRSIALSRDPRGRIEIFLVGDRITPSYPSLEQAMEYRDDWQTSNEASLSANQIVLPQDDYFNSAAALICVEVLEAGYSADPVAAFARVEPLIDKFINASEQIGDQILVGLFGELVLLDVLTARSQGATRDRVVHAWAGWKPSSRDFQLGPVGVEVKTTTGATSIHRVQGFHQVEVGHPVTDVAETSLHLLSLGVLPLPDGHSSGRTVPELVDQILARIPSPDERDHFLERIQQYGGDTAAGYRHTRDKHKPRFNVRFSLTFERLYNLADDHLHVLRRQDVTRFTNIDADSVEFRIDLPFPFRGSINPISGLETISGVLLDTPGQD